MTGMEQMESSMQPQWHIIKRNISKCSGTFAAVERRNESGKTFDDKVCNTCTLYETQNRTSFTIMHLWLLLRTTEKWKDLSQKPKAKTTTVGLAVADQNDASKLSESGTDGNK